MRLCCSHHTPTRLLAVRLLATIAAQNEAACGNVARFKLQVCMCMVVHVSVLRSRALGNYRNLEARARGQQRDALACRTAAESARTGDDDARRRAHVAGRRDDCVGRSRCAGVCRRSCVRSHAHACDVRQVLRDSQRIASHRWDPDTTLDLYYDIARGYRCVIVCECGHVRCSCT
jgi:hypothetical protein